MTKSISFLIIIITLSVVAESCGLFGNGTQESPEISRLRLTAGELIEANYYTYLSQIDTSSSNYSFDKETFGLGISIAGFNWSSSLLQQPFSIFGSAYADDPGPTTSKYNPALISIYSDSALVVDDVSYEAGSSLTPLFEARRTYDNWQTVLKMLENFGAWEEYDPILLRFKTAPTNRLNQRFLVTVTMENGAIFHLKSPIIKTE